MTSAYDPIPVTILAIDPGRTSGWAVFVQAVAPGSSFNVKDLERTKAKETMS